MTDWYFAVLALLVMLGLIYIAVASCARQLGRIADELHVVNQRPISVPSPVSDPPEVTLSADTIQDLAGATARAADHYRLYGETY